MLRQLDSASVIVIGITLILFIAALFVKGFTHDLFLETGVLLVSAKIVIMAYRSNVTANRVERKLDELIAQLGRLENQKNCLSNKKYAAQIREEVTKAEQSNSVDG